MLGAEKQPYRHLPFPSCKLSEIDKESLSIYTK